jgi:alpha-methylacyl-CoA racemase
MNEAPRHPHNLERATFIEIDGVVQPAPAPRFSRTPAARPTSPEKPGAGGRAALSQWGISETEITRMSEAGAILLDPDNEQATAPELR